MADSGETRAEARDYIWDQRSAVNVRLLMFGC